MRNNFFENILVISPHTDDGELAAGGTIRRFVEEGSNVSYIALSAPRKELKEECAECLGILGVEDYFILDFPRRRFPEKRQEILQYLFDYNKEHRVDLVLTPSTQDLHQDHQTVTNEVMRAFKHSTIFGYELPWNNIIFHENCFISLNGAHVEKKLRALKCYDTQKTRLYFDREYLHGLLRAKGLHIGEKYAESFEVIKLVLS
ncbi:MAG: PIG-L family deacetylase [Candidatus Bathyarchaeota archaeon]|nr:PIG-L family deacetylase [Candidatus Bathyarchaeota archaeon]